MMDMLGEREVWCGLAECEKWSEKWSDVVMACDDCCPLLGRAT